MNACADTVKKELALPLLRRMAEMLKVLAHAQRLKIVNVLECAESAPVFAIMEQVGLSQATASHHLNAMRRVGLLKSERRGKEVWYSIADPRALTILDCIRKKTGDSVE